MLDEQVEAARDALSNALTSVREAWEPKTTANNLALLRGARRERGQHEPWLDEIVHELDSALSLRC